MEDRGAAATTSLRERLEAELQLICEVGCHELVQSALERTGQCEVPTTAAGLSSFIQTELRASLDERFQDTRLSERACERVGSVLIPTTGAYKIPSPRDVSAGPLAAVESDFDDDDWDFDEDSFLNEELAENETCVVKSQAGLRARARLQKKQAAAPRDEFDADEFDADEFDAVLEDDFDAVLEDETRIARVEEQASISDAANEAAELSDDDFDVFEEETRVRDPFRGPTHRPGPSAEDERDKQSA